MDVTIAGNPPLLGPVRDLTARAATFAGCPAELAGRFAEAVERLVTSVAKRSPPDDREGIRLRYEYGEDSVLVDVAYRLRDATSSDGERGLIEQALTGHGADQSLRAMIDGLETRGGGTGHSCRLICQVSARR